MSPSRAEAQSPERERLSIGLAAGIANPWHGDFDFTATSWQGDIRWRTGRFFASNVFFEQWRHTTEEISPGAGSTRYQTSVVGWNLLGIGRAGRATISGGGGISYLLYSRDSPVTDFHNSSFSAQLQGGIDVLLAPHVAAMGQYRMVVPIQDPGGGHHTFLAGARFMF